MQYRQRRVAREMVASNYCRWLVEGWYGEMQQCARAIGPRDWLCTQHEGLVIDHLERRYPNRRRRYSLPGDAREIDVLRARIDDLVRQARFAEASVYYARRADGMVKIGYSISVDDRMAQLRGEYGKLEVLATEPGGYEVEGVRHDQFRSLRVEREWFRPGAELLAHIKRLQIVQEPLPLRLADEGVSGQERIRAAMGVGRESRRG